MLGRITRRRAGDLTVRTSDRREWRRHQGNERQESGRAALERRGIVDLPEAHHLEAPDVDLATRKHDAERQLLVGRPGRKEIEHGSEDRGLELQEKLRVVAETAPRHVRIGRGLEFDVPIVRGVLVPHLDHAVDPPCAGRELEHLRGDCGPSRVADEAQQVLGMRERKRLQPRVRFHRQPSMNRPKDGIRAGPGRSGDIAKYRSRAESEGGAHVLRAQGWGAAGAVPEVPGATIAGHDLALDGRSCVRAGGDRVLAARGLDLPEGVGRARLHRHPARGPPRPLRLPQGPHAHPRPPGPGGDRGGRRHTATCPSPCPPTPRSSRASCPRSTRCATTWASVWGRPTAPWPSASRPRASPRGARSRPTCCARRRGSPAASTATTTSW